MSVRDPRPPWFAHAACGLLVAVGLWLRLAHIGFGLPANFHPDEINATAETMGFLAGRAELHKYQHPPLIKNLAFVGLRLHGLVGHGPRPPAPETVTLALRLVSALAGAATIYVLFLVAYPLAGLVPALLAALLLAVFPLAIGCSMYGAPDMLLAFLYLAAFACHLRLARVPSAWLHGLAGWTLGLAVGAKYTGAFLLPSLVVAHLAGRCARAEEGLPPPGWRAWLALAGGLLLGLAIAFPLLPFELRDILHGGSEEVTHTMVTGHFGVRVSGRQFGMVWHFAHSILPSGGPVVVAAIVLGLAVLVRRRRTSDWLILAAIVPHYFVIEWAWLIPPSPQRYVLPLLPLYLLALAIGLGSLAARARTVRARTLTLAVATLLLLPFPVWKSARFLASASPDTRELMTAWMRDHIPPGAFVLYEPMRSHHSDTRALPLRWVAIDATRPLPLVRPGQVAYFMASSFVYQRYLDWPLQVPERTRFYERLLATGDLVHEESRAGGPFLFHNPELRLYRLSR